MKIRRPNPNLRIKKILTCKRHASKVEVRHSTVCFRETMLRAICLSLLVLAVVMGSTAGFKTRSSAVGSRSSRLLAGFGGGVRGADGGVSGAPPSAHARCPCNSDGKLAYKDCCQPYHTGAAINTPETLIRSRFSAFASGNTGIYR